MVRIRIGQAWKEDPSARGALLGAEGPSARAAAAREIVDVVSIEVDGVDIGAGRTEGSLLSAAEGLVRAVARLVAGEAQASVPFQEGAVELLLRRRGGSVLLSVVTLHRPARILARDVEVDLAALAKAAREASSRLCQDIAEVQPLAASEPISRRLIHEATQLGRAAAIPAEGPPSVPRSRPHRPRRRRGAPACSFELRDEEGLIASYRGPGPDLGSLIPAGRIALRSSNGHEIFSLPGVPFLLLRDLSASAARLVAALRAGEHRWTTMLALSGRRGNLHLSLDLASGSLSVDGRPATTCSPLFLAQAFLEAAVDFSGAILARNPRQSSNGYLTELRAGASELLAHVREMLSGDLVAVPSAGVKPERRRSPSRLPLGPGRIRRLAFRHLFMAEIGAPCGLLRSGRQVVASGTSTTLCLGPDGAATWRGPGAEFCGAAAGVLLLWANGRLSCLDRSTGVVRWTRSSPLPDAARPAGVWPVGNSGVALAGPSSLCAVDLATGRTAWRFAPPAASTLVASAFGALLVAGTDTGLLYGVDAEGRVAWRLRYAGSLVAAPEPVGMACLATSRTERGGSLLALDPATGRRLWEAPLDFAPSGAPVCFAGLLGVAGAVAGDAVVAAVDLDGRPAWTTAPSLGCGALSLAGLRSGIAVKSPEGPCALVDRCGSFVWSRAREATHPPPGNVAPMVARGVLLCSSEHVEALDVATGALLGVAPLVAPVRLLADDELTIYAVDAEGLLTVARLATRLSVV
jgi:outer membrane protein assembly factor BamB